MYVKKDDHIVNTDTFDNINLDLSHNSVGFHRLSREKSGMDRERTNKERFIFSFENEGSAEIAYLAICAGLKKGENMVDLTKIL